MGVDYNAYVGPYIRVHNPPKDSTEKYYTCVNNKCGNHEKDVSSEYCSECGKKIELLEIPCKERIDFDVYEEFGDRLAESLSEYRPDEFEDYQFFVPNTGKIGNHVDCRDTSVKSFDLEKPKMEINHFTSAFKKEIARIKKVFGKDVVVIEWGVLVWQS